jgi:putative transposase
MRNNSNKVVEDEKNLMQDFVSLVTSFTARLYRILRSRRKTIEIKTFLTGSDGLRVENPKYFRENQKKLSRAQKHLSRKKKGSTRRRKAKLKIARIHNKIVNQRRDFIHKIIFQLIDNYDIISIGDLNTAGMVKNHKLAKSINDASFSKVYNVLSYKAKWYGKEVIKIDRWFASSKTCSCCGWKDKHLTLSDRTFVCKLCGFKLDRDLNASRSILKEALRVSNAL